MLEQVLGRLSGDDGIGHGIGVTLIRVVSLPEAALEVDPRSLLYGVSSLVSSRVEVWRLPERKVAAERERLGRQCIRGDGGCAADMGADFTQIVVPERPLNLIEMG